MITLIIVAVLALVLLITIGITLFPILLIAGDIAIAVLVVSAPFLIVKAIKKKKGE